MEIPSPEERIEKAEKSVGAMVGSVVVVAILIAGGIYFLVMEELERRGTPDPVINEGQARLE